MDRRKNGKTWQKRLGRDMKINFDAYLLIIPVLVYYIIFAYKPMYGAIIAFKDFSPGLGIMKSPFTKNFGLMHFKNFFSSYYFGRVLSNTLIISLTSLIAGFPAPIILALALNELRSNRFKRIVQTISYMPHFISLIVVCSLVHNFTANTGIITKLLNHFGFPEVSMLSKPQYFVPVYVLSGIWQEIGWGSIIYLAALSGIDAELYEAAEIDGAGRWRQMLHVTLPGILNTIIIMFVLRMGSIMSVGFEKIILLYNPGTYKKADVISTFVYRKGLQDYDWSYSSAVGLFNSVINFALVVTFNRISRRISEVSLW